MPFLEIILAAIASGVVGSSITAAGLSGKYNERLHQLESKMLNNELVIAQTYLSKADFQLMLDRVESHMVRIEQKLDNIVNYERAASQQEGSRGHIQSTT
jgi:uncharacterized coiled-coil protein SlyX